MSKSRVLVCGATGFIGRNVIERFACRDDLEVYGTYFSTQPTRLFANSDRVSFVRADLTDRNEVNAVTEGMDVVIQAAAVTTGAKDVVTRPYIHVTDNAVMNSLIFRACFEHKVKHVVFFSCTIMYPDIGGAVREADFNYQIIDKYFGVGWTKVYIEKMCEFYSRISNTRYTAIRHSNIYGPHDKFDLERSHVFGATIAKVMNPGDGNVVVWGDGSEERDLLYVSDLVDFVETVIESQQEPFELINIGYGASISIKHLVETIIQLSGRPRTIEYDTTKPTINFSLTLNIDKAQQKYKWKPRVALEEGISKTLSWYQDNILSVRCSK